MLHEDLFQRLWTSLAENRQSYLDYYRSHHERRQAELGFPFHSGWRLPLLPFFISDEHRGRIESDLAGLLDLLGSTTERFFEGDAARHADFLGLSEEARHLCRGQRIGKSDTQIMRPDGFLTEQSLMIVEANLDTGVGAYPQQQMQAQFHLENLRLVDDLAKAGRTMRPLIALEGLATHLASLPQPVWRINPRAGSGSLIAQKIDAIEADYLKQRVPGLLDIGPEHLRREGGRIFFGGTEVGSVFRHISTYSYAERAAEFSALNLGHADGPVLCANPATMILENKLNLALLSEAAAAATSSLSDEQRALIQRCVPWTRRFGASLAAVVSTEKDRYVLKKAGGRSARHLFVGVDLCQEKFEEGIRQALEEGGWIVQERVAPMPWSNAFLVDGQIERAPTAFMMAAFFIAGRLAGIDCVTALRKTDGGGGLCNSPGYAQHGGGAIVVVSEGQASGSSPGRPSQSGRCRGGC